MSQFSAAVIGTGFIGPVHVEGLRRAGVHVVGILGSNRQKSEQAATQLELETAYASLDELLADERIDVVHVTSPNRFHFHQTAAAINAGKHVLCEKPLAMNSNESQQLVQLASEAEVVTGVNYNIRYYPLCVEAADRIQRGSLGNVFHVAGSYVQDWLFHDTDFNWRVNSADGGPLRAIADIGTHWLDLIQHVVGQKVIAVCADLQTVYARRRRRLGSNQTFSGEVDEAASFETVGVNTEDYGCVMLRFANGAKGVVWVSQVTAGRKNCLRFELAGSNESLAWNSESPNQLWIGNRDTANQLLLRDPALLSEKAAAASHYPGGHNEGFPDTFKQLFLDFYGYLEQGELDQPRSFPTFQDGHQEVLLCEAILQSHRQQQWITVGE